MSQTSAFGASEPAEPPKRELCPHCQLPMRNRGMVEHKACARKAAAAPTAPGFQEVKDHYHATFLRLTGHAPTITGRECRSIQSLARAAGPEKAKRMIDFALTNERTRSWATINSIARDPDRFVPRAGAEPRRPMSTMQPRAEVSDER